MPMPRLFLLDKLEDVAQAMVAPGKSILAADESPKTMQQRFNDLGLVYSPHDAHLFRTYEFTLEGLYQYVGGVILHEDTLEWHIEGELTGTYLARRGVLPGAKVDIGLENFPGHRGQQMTRGLDEMDARLDRLKALGIRFAKARSVYRISDTLTSYVMSHNARWQAIYAAKCLARGVVPIVEPEVLAEGDHSTYQCRLATTRVLNHVYRALEQAGVRLDQIILKPNMVTPGLQSGKEINPVEVAEATHKALRLFNTSDIAGIAFLSGGLTPDEATACLLEINLTGNHGIPYTGSFGRASQREALEALDRLSGEPEFVQRNGVQSALLRRLTLVSRATKGLGPA